MTIRETLLRLVAWTRRDRLSRELADEMDAHVELLARDLEHEGMPREDALAAARRQVGNATVLKEASRDSWGFPRLDAVLQDVRYAVRGLTRSPGFTATVVVTLGLGIGANAAMFAVVDRLMLRPFPYMRDPDTVHRLYFQVTINGQRRTWITIPYTRYLDIERGTRSFSEYAAISEWRLAVGRGQDTRVRKVAGVSASFFDFFSARPERGRFFGPAEDDTPMGALVAVLSHAYWASEFGSRDVLGEALQIGGMAYTIVGVAPHGFVGTVSGRVPEIWVPITTIPANIDRSNSNTYWTAYNWDWMEVLVRRKPGISVTGANADLTTAFRQSRAAQRAANPRVLPDSVAHPVALAAAVRTAAGPDAGLESRVLIWVVGVAAIVLLIACANVANLMLARILRRRREIAVRLALGVRRGRLIGQFVTEGFLLALFGALGGLIAAQWGSAAIRRFFMPLESAFDLRTDWRTIGVAIGCALVAVLLTTVGPAILATRSDVASALKAGARDGGYRSSRTRSALLVMQGTLSVVLLVGAALFVRSLRNVLAIPLGYDVSRVLEIYPDFRGVEMDSASRVAVRRRLLATAQSIPGVEAAARVNNMLFGTNTTSLRVPGIDSVERLGRFNFLLTSPDYFKVMRTRIIRGRGFDERDREGAPLVAIVSSSMARVLWPGKDALGECIQVSWASRPRAADAPCTTIIGIAEDAARQGIIDEQRFLYYLNVDQSDAGWSSIILTRLSSDNLDANMERVRRAMQRAMPGDGFVVMRPLQEILDNQRRSWRLGATLFMTFGGLALLVAAVGLYGAIAYNVAQRMHELGVRIALGARALNILRLVVGQGVAFAGAGVAIGLTIAAIVSPALEPLLYKLSPRDPLTYAVVGGIMAVVGIAASTVPALRAVRADPNRALRTE